jgi:4'-phosphopantetheinyl transferase
MSVGWHVAPGDLELSATQLDVWRIPVNDIGDEVLSRMESLLSADELKRAWRFHFRQDRIEYTTARSSLRRILARYTRSDPRQLALTYAAMGKPMLADSAISFNLSHSHGLAVCAVAMGREVGIDVERVRERASCDQIAERFFSPREFAAYRKVSAEERLRAFFECWTRKEAFLKARGSGLAFPLDQFDVSLGPGKPAALLHVANEPDAPARWIMANLDLGANHIGALAHAGPALALRMWILLDAV